MLNYTFLPTTLKFVIKFLHSITNYVCSITPSLLHIHPYYVGNFSDGLPSPIANECIRKKTSRKELLMEVFLFLCRLQGIIIKSRQRWIKDFGLFDFKMDPNKVCMVFESTVWISVFFASYFIYSARYFLESCAFSGDIHFLHFFLWELR